MPKVLRSRPTDSASSKSSSLRITWSNLGKGRVVYDNFKVHRSVRTRILAGHTEEVYDYLPHIRVKTEADEQPQCLTKEEWPKEEPDHFEWVD